MSGDRNFASAVNAYQQAFETLAQYEYELALTDGVYSLSIVNNMDTTIYNESSSDFFTLMQYFYKWERGQK